MYTDPTCLHAHDARHVDRNSVFSHPDAFYSDWEEVAELSQLYRTGRVGAIILKKRLAEIINTRLSLLRERCEELLRHPGSFWKP